MPKHDVTFALPARKLGRSDVKFQIRRDGETFGTLKISNGTLVWFPRGAARGHRMGWKRFDQLMQAKARQSERR